MTTRRAELPDPAEVCCEPLAARALTPAEADELADRLKALADPSRLRLLSLLLAAPEPGLCTCDLTGPLALSQPTVSHHLRKLVDTGLIDRQRVGVWTYYRVRTSSLTAIAQTLTGN